MATPTRRAALRLGPPPCHTLPSNTRMLPRRMTAETVGCSRPSSGFAGGGPLNAPQMAAEAAGSVLRLSPHYYNTEDEVDAAITALGDLLSR